MLQANQLIGPYTLIMCIGRGGFGEVWLAERRTSLLTNEIAVKLPLDEQVDLETIKQEAALWKQASGHSNILPIIEANIYDGQIVIVSEYAPDGSLADLLKRRGVPPTEKAVEIAYGILAGLEFLHSRRIIHRDLKPANILMQGGTPRLADFGISRALKATQTSQSVNITGTPPYMAPEAFDGKRNVQTDIWSVGVIFYYLLAGRLPFPQQDITSLLGAIISRNPDQLPESVPQSLKNVVSGALAKKPAQRFKSAAEMQKALWNAVNVREKPPISIPIEHGDDESPTVVAAPKPKTAKKSTLAASANVFFCALLIFLFLGGITFLIFQELNNNNSQNSNEKVQRQPPTDSLPSNSKPSVNLSTTVSATKTPKTPSPIQPPTQPLPTQPPPEMSQDDINKRNEEVLKTAQNNLEQEMFQTAQRKAIELHPGSNFEGRAAISNEGQYDRKYTFLMKGKYLGIDKFRVVITVNGEITRQGNTIFPKILGLQINENYKITN